MIWIHISRSVVLFYYLRPFNSICFDIWYFISSSDKLLCVYGFLLPFYLQYYPLDQWPPDGDVCSVFYAPTRPIKESTKTRWKPSIHKQNDRLQGPQAVNHSYVIKPSLPLCWNRSGFLLNIMERPIKNILRENPMHLNGTHNPRQ